MRTRDTTIEREGGGVYMPPSAVAPFLAGYKLLREENDEMAQLDSAAHGAEGWELTPRPDGARLGLEQFTFMFKWTPFDDGTNGWMLWQQDAEGFHITLVAKARGAARHFYSFPISALPTPVKESMAKW